MLHNILTRYLQQKIQNGSIKDGHPETMTQAITGMFFFTIISSNNLDGQFSPELDVYELVSQFADKFIFGTLAKQKLYLGEG